MNNLYVLVDYNQNQIITPVDQLPEDWSNINGLDILEEEKLKDLKWAGHDFLGWFNLSDPDLHNYEVTDQWLELSKLKIKSLISSERWEKENELLTFMGKQLKIDERTKLSLVFTSSSIQQDETINWKFLNGTYTITASELAQMHNFVTSYIQQCFNIEYEFSTLIDNIKVKEDLFNLNINIVWPDTVAQ